MTTNFVRKKDLLAEIAKSKNSYCWAKNETYFNYHIITEDLTTITPDILTTKASELSIAVEQVVVRHMCNEHVPILVRKNTRGIKHTRHKTPFPPFKHFVWQNGEWMEVVRSHWEGGLHNGVFNIHHGKITNKLANMLMLMVERYALRPNWRNYTWVDEMKSHALMELCKNALKFNEAKGDNPFAYITMLMNNSFKIVLRDEKDLNNYKNEQLVEHGGYELTPSQQAQLDIDRYYGKETPIKKIIGDKPKKKPQEDNPFFTSLFAFTRNN